MHMVKCLSYLSSELGGVCTAHCPGNAQLPVCKADFDTLHFLNADLDINVPKEVKSGSTVPLKNIQCATTVYQIQDSSGLL